MRNNDHLIISAMYLVPLGLTIREIVNGNSNTMIYVFMIGIPLLMFYFAFSFTKGKEHLTKRTKIRHRFVADDNKFNPQYRWFGIWRNILRSNGFENFYLMFNTIEESQKYVDDIIEIDTAKKIPDSYHYN